MIPAGDEMHCLRCGGLMLIIRMRETASNKPVPGWRCLLCGEVIDPGIAANRKDHQEPSRKRPRLPES